MTDQITQLLIKLEYLKNVEVTTYEQASDRFLAMELIEDELYELGYIVED